jgi:hypothetical protein
MRPQPSADDRWVTGDHFRLHIPADPAALRAGGAAFLTEAFRVSGALIAGNAVTRISRYQEVPGGSSGRKRVPICGSAILTTCFASSSHRYSRVAGRIMAVAWLLDVPALVRSRFGDAARSLSRNDPLIKDDESVRAPLQMLTNALSLWGTRHFGDLLDALG